MKCNIYLWKVETPKFRNRVVILSPVHWNLPSDFWRSFQDPDKAFFPTLLKLKIKSLSRTSTNSSESHSKFGTFKGHFTKPLSKTQPDLTHPNLTFPLHQNPPLRQKSATNLTETLSSFSNGRHSDYSTTFERLLMKLSYTYLNASVSNTGHTTNCGLRLNPRSKRYCKRRIKYAMPNLRRYA